MRLNYKAVTRDGKSVTGVIEANDVKEAATYLREKDLIPIEIVNKEDNTLSKLLPGANKVKSEDLILFTRQLSSMLTSGLTLVKSLDILKQQITHKGMLEVTANIIADIEEGKTFSAAIAKHPNVFSSIYISLIKAGENSGLLDKVLLRLADNLEKQAKLKSTIKGALMYPLIVIVLMLVVVFIMMIFVIPQLSVLYDNLNIALPLPTQIIVGMSNLVIRFWPLMILVVGLIIYLLRKWRKTPDGRLITDNLVLRLPVFGKLISQSILAEFSRTFGLLVGTGSLVVESLNQTASITGNIHYENAIKDIGKRVEKGVTIGDAMSYYALFPPILVQLVKIGEQTGKIDETLQKASEYFETEVNQTVKTLTTAMEPFIMIVLGVGVAFLIISVITPIYSLISTIQ